MKKIMTTVTAAVLALAVWGEVSVLKVPEAPFPLEIAVWTPPERTFSIADFGAKPDGTPVTEALERAIAACSAAGGGKVVVPAGEWIVGAFDFKSNVALVLEKDAVLHFPDDPVVVMRAPLRADRKPTMTHPALVNAAGCTNVAILGTGTLKADVDYWHKNFMVNPVKGFPRPHFLRFSRCRNVRLEDFKVRGSPSWTLHLSVCDDILLRGVDSLCDGPNTDGLDLDSCNRALVENCTLNQGDDTYTIKSGKDEAGRKRNIPCQNVFIRNCIAGGHTLLGIGSEVSGGIRNICMRDCTVTSDAVRMIYIKTNSRRGGFVENIWAENICGKRARFGVVGIDQYYDGNPVKELGKKYVKTYPTRIANVNVRNIECGLARNGVQIVGDKELMPTGVRISDVRVGNSLNELVSVKGCEDVKIENVRKESALLAKYGVKPELGFALEWNPHYRTDVPYEVEIARGRMGWAAGMPGGAGFEVVAETAAGARKLDVTMLPGKTKGNVRLRFCPPTGTLALRCQTAGRAAPADPQKVDNLFAGVKVADGCRATVPAALAGQPVVFELTVRNTDADEAHGAAFALRQYDAAGKLLPETVVDRRWTGHNYPAGNVSQFHEEGRLHPKAATVELVGANQYVVPVKLALRAATVLPFPKYDDANFAPGASGEAGDFALRLGGERRNAFWYQTRSHASWAGPKQLRQESDIFFPSGAGTVEAWFRSDWKVVDGAEPYTLVEGWQRFRADHGKKYFDIMSLTYDPKAGKLAFKIRDVSGKAFAGEGAATLKAGAWTHVAAQWQPEGEAAVFVDGKKIVAFPLKGWTVFDLAKDPLPNDAHATECYLGSSYRGARKETEPDAKHPFVDGEADAFRVSTGCRYADGFTPARSFAVDADTRALFTFDRTFDGVSGGGLAWMPGTFRSDCDRVDHVLDFGDFKIDYYPKDIQPANDPRYVFDIVNYPRTPSVADFEAARRPFRQTAELKPGETLRFDAPADVRTDFVEIANVSDGLLACPILLNAGDIDPRSEGDLVETMGLKNLSPRDRVNRIFQYVLGASDYFMNHTLMFEPSTDTPRTVEYEALRMLNGYCGFECGPLNNMTANLFVKVAGCPASITAGYGHEFEQVFFDGKNHIYDLSAQKFFPAMDNMTSAYLKEAGDQPYALGRMGNSPDHFIRLSSRGFWLGSVKKLPRVGVTLAPGESFRVWQVNDAQCNDLQTRSKTGLYRGEATASRPDYTAETHGDGSKMFIQRAERYFPHYLNGFITFAGVPSAANAAFTNVTADSFCYRVESGYPIVHAEYAATRKDGSAAAIEISTDGGATYRPLVSPADYAVRARYAYLVRVNAPMADIAAFRASTEVQLNPRVFPGRIREGKNAFTLKAASGVKAKVTVQGRVAAKRLAFDGRVVHSGTVPGVELAFTAFDSAKTAEVGVTGAGAAATVKCFGNVTATLTGGRLALRAKEPKTVGFGAVTVVDEGAEKTLTVLTGPNVRLATAADATVAGDGVRIASADATSPQARVVFTKGGRASGATYRFDALPAGKYAVLNLNRFRSHPGHPAADALSMGWDGEDEAKTATCGRPRNDACNYYKANYNRPGERANFKWDYPYQAWTFYPYHGMSVRKYPAGSSVRLFAATDDETESVAVLVVPDPSFDLRGDLVKILCGLNCDPWRIAGSSSK